MLPAKEHQESAGLSYPKRRRLLLEECDIADEVEREECCWCCEKSWDGWCCERMSLLLLRSEARRVPPSVAADGAHDRARKLYHGAAECASCDEWRGQKSGCLEWNGEREEGSQEERMLHQREGHAHEQTKIRLLRRRKNESAVAAAAAVEVCYCCFVV